MSFDETPELTPERWDEAKALFDPAPGVDLSDAYADRMATRTKRDEIERAGKKQPVDDHGRLRLGGHDAATLKLAHKYETMSEIDFGMAVSALDTRYSAAVLRDVRALAAAVLAGAGQ